LIIEVDGSQHLGSTEKDATRTKLLEQRGYHVLRFWNGDVVDNIDGVARAILNALNLY
jgi:very-short-patch-repair endonuclease